jgi:hypothetical protein
MRYAHLAADQIKQAARARLGPIGALLVKNRTSTLAATD